MKARQRVLRVFVFDENISQEQFEAYIQRNFPLLAGFLLLFSHKLTSTQKELLQKHNLVFLEQENNSFDSLKFRDSPTTTRSEPILQQTPVKQEVGEIKEIPSYTNKTKTLTFMRNIRSGELIETQGDVVIFGRVNSGAKIVCEGNLQVFGGIDGYCCCDGDFIVFESLGIGEIIFKGQVINKDLEILNSFKNNSLKKAIMQDGILLIEEVTI